MIGGAKQIRYALSIREEHALMEADADTNIAKGNPSLGAPVELSAQSRPFSPPGFLKCNKDSHAQENSNNENVVIAEQPICVFAAAGNCPHGESCPHLHGKLCPTCEKYVLHPYRQNEREEHIRTCERKRKDLETFKLSQEIECSVCLERVLSKPMAAERKFGLLSECDHPFCISCIRSWRSNSPTSGMDVNTALRACPICRKLSYFVIPSAIWYSRQEEKQQIVHNYKAKLRSIDCKHFDYGNGSCPFGTSCFYKHTYQPHRYGHRQHSYGSSGILSDGEEEVDDLDEFAPDIYDWEDFIIQEELEDLNDDDIDTEDDIEEAFLLMQLLALDVSSADEN
ncbi:hypothetical protein GIB67_018158 [Kingdonia uniflora]|uniref:RING-type E3 ubiquitin transferase n=1 Tax=Kingdonia uniflora TaxID=39325 RepID=A0A7J7NN07_9MAGN|nr:hypothetical protein GIB67_018158 [Kingdonia uniflora]